VYVLGVSNPNVHAFYFFNMRNLSKPEILHEPLKIKIIVTIKSISL
jgi:hypothetical protein